MVNLGVLYVFIRSKSLEWNESFFMPCGQKSNKNLFENHRSLAAQKYMIETNYH
jgi:hypothetical protein